MSGEHGGHLRFPGDFLYLDESGDLGATERSTPVFVLGILHLRSQYALARVIKRARRKALGRRAPANELKWSGSSERVRTAVIEQICRDAGQIAGISAAVIEKAWIQPRLARRKEDIRYNYAVRFAMEKGGLFDSSCRGRRVRLTIDARNRRATETLSEYVALLRSNDELACDVTVSAADSARFPQLQVADFAVGAIYAAYAHKRWHYLNALKKAGIAVMLRALKMKTPAP